MSSIHCMRTSSLVCLLSLLLEGCSIGRSENLSQSSAHNDRDCLDVLQAFREGQGYIIQAFTSAKDFLLVIKPGAFRLILLDFAMPEMSRYQLLENVKCQDLQVPVMAVTGMAFEDRNRAGATGFADSITKPFTDMLGSFNLITKHTTREVRDIS
jgi:CheY-like chemotaxis protein